MTMRARQVRFAALRVTATVMFIVYVCWNVYWLAHGQMAPSMLWGATGLPGPTTGLTRALLRLVAGDVSGFLAYDALAVPTILLFLWCIFWLMLLAVRRRALLLPRWMLPVWGGLLAVSWILKLCGDRQYW
jgi:hypothetical protein